MVIASWLHLFIFQCWLLKLSHFIAFSASDREIVDMPLHALNSEQSSNHIKMRDKTAQHSRFKKLLQEEKRYLKKQRESKNVEVKPLIQFTQAPHSKGIDYVIVAFDEPPRPFLDRLEDCISPALDRVFIYINARNNFRSHGNRPNGFINPKASFRLWSDASAAFNKSVVRVPGSYCCDEAPGFLMHIATHYHDLRPHTAFLHAHVASYHSGDVCSIVKTGVRKLSADSQTTPPSSTGYVDINAGGYPLRCFSQRKQDYQGPGYAQDGLDGKWRDNVYDMWSFWTAGAPLPHRIVVACCMQSVVTSQSLQRRPLKTWQALLDAAARSSPPFEYLWPVLMDEAWSNSTGTC